MQFTVIKRYHSYNQTTGRDSSEVSIVVEADDFLVSCGVLTFYNKDGKSVSAFREWESVTSIKER